MDTVGLWAECKLCPSGTEISFVGATSASDCKGRASVCRNFYTYSGMLKIM